MYYLSTKDMGLVGLGVLIIIVIVLGYYRFHRHRNNLHTWRRNLASSLQIFNQVIAARAPIDLYLNGTRTRLARVKCRAIDSKFLLLEIVDGQINTHQMKKPLQAYFHIKETAFYDFVGSISDSIMKDGNNYLQMPIPTELGNSQRRQFVRQPLKPGMLKKVVYYIAQLGPDGVVQLENGRRHWNRLDTPAGIKMLDISASGLLLHCPREMARSAALQPGQYMLFELNLAPAGTAYSKDIQLTGVVVRSLVLEESYQLGIHLVRWTEKPLPCEKADWKIISSGEGVPLLATWIMQLQQDIRQGKWQDQGHQASGSSNAALSLPLPHRDNPYADDLLVTPVSGSAFKTKGNASQHQPQLPPQSPD